MTTESRRYPPLLIESAMSLSAGEGVLQTDGTIWSHAATLGTRTKGTQFTIDRACVESFVKNFTAGSRTKVPVDYDHGSTDDDPEIRRARAMGKVPKAGDVVEMQGVFAPEDFTGSLRAAAEKLASQATPARALGDDRNYGLWIRWRPTQKALQAIQAREYTELSIAFDDDWPNNVDGQGQGPTVLAVALLNLPFLTDMLPVAASMRAHGGSPAAPGTGDTRMSTKALTLLAGVAALVGKPVTDEDQAITELSGFTPEVTRLRSFNTAVAAEIGETDPAKAAEKVKQLKAENARLDGEAKAATKARIDGEIEATLKKYEKRLTVPLKAMFATQLRAELEKGTELAKTEAVKALESMTELGIVGQATGGDVGGANADDDVKIDAKARELMTTNPRLKAMVSAGKEYDAYTEALSLAARDLNIGRPQLVTT